jgi:hypothetical protein
LPNLEHQQRPQLMRALPDALAALIDDMAHGSYSRKNRPIHLTR